MRFADEVAGQADDGHVAEDFMRRVDAEGPASRMVAARAAIVADVNELARLEQASPTTRATMLREASRLATDMVNNGAGPSDGHLPQRAVRRTVRVHRLRPL